MRCRVHQKVDRKLHVVTKNTAGILARTIGELAPPVFLLSNNPCLTIFVMAEGTSYASDGRR